MLKNILPLILLTLISTTSFAKDFGLGVILFGPTGFSGNYYFGDNSIDGAFAWSSNDKDQKFYIHSTYLWHQNNYFKIDKASFDTYYGLGGRIISWDDPPGDEEDDETRLGLRGAIGANYDFRKIPLEAFGELSLTMDIIPETDADLDIGLGLRYYF